jgi:hypothetical protein
MQCQITRMPVYFYEKSQDIHPELWSGLLNQLQPKRYENIDTYKEFLFPTGKAAVLIGEKCGKPVVRINNQEAINDLGIDRIQKNGNQLQLIGVKDRMAVLISCDM